MRAWTCTTFKGHHPVGAAAVVVAECEETALHWLKKELQSHGLTGLRSDSSELTNVDLKPLPVHSGRLCRVLNDGNY